jgi:hypothetical protein
MIEDMGEVTVLPGASSRTGPKSGEPVEPVSEPDPPPPDDPADGNPPGAGAGH